MTRRYQKRIRRLRLALAIFEHIWIRKHVGKSYLGIAEVYAPEHDEVPGVDCPERKA